MEKDRTLGSYKVVEELSTSSICTVYRGFEDSLDRPVLLKKLHPQMALEDDIRERFAREARVCAQVKHENIVDIYGYFSEPDLTMLVLEFVEGQSLGALIAGRDYIPWNIVTIMLFGVLKGLAHAHTKGVLHRDIKPDNILISNAGRVKITDFGLASIEGSSKLTQQGIIVGTPAYMPPEQISGGVLDQKSDLFSLGATFYETLTNITPFQGESFSETMKNVLDAKLQPPSFTIPDIPLELDQIILRLLEKQPTRRFATAEQALSEVRKFIDAQQIVVNLDVVKEFISTGKKDSSIRRERPASSSVVIAPKTRFNNTWIVGVLGAALIIAVYFLPINSNKSLENETALSENLINAVNRAGLKAILSETTNRKEITPTVSNVSPNRPSTEPADSQSQNFVIDTSAHNSQHDVSETVLKGSLRISSRPWANLSINDVYYGQTPLSSGIELDPGDYDILLVNDELPTHVMEKVTITSGDEIRLDIDLWSYFAIIKVVSVKPWAEVFVDNVSYGETPRAKPIILAYGEHIVELRNPSFETWRKVIKIEKNDDPYEIVADLN